MEPTHYTKLIDEATKVDNKIRSLFNNVIKELYGNPEYSYLDLMEEYPSVTTLINIMTYFLNTIHIENATAARFSETFGNSDNFAGKLYNYVNPGKSDVFIYYSGHGAPDLQNKGSYFVPIDVDPNYIATSGYSLDLFYKNISKIPAKSVTIVLDTCFSGNSDGGFLLRNMSPAILKSKSVFPSINQAAIFTSSKPDQISTWHHEKKHGLFTYYFLKGLTGAADTNRDSDITSTELGSYLAQNVPMQARKMNGQIQTPTLTQQKELVITTLANNSATLESSTD